MWDGVEAFERWLRSAEPRPTLPRLLLGTLLVGLCWVAFTFAVMAAGAFLYMLWTRPDPAMVDFNGFLAGFLVTPGGVLTLLATFSGIWVGLALAMRWCHREPLAALFGLSRRIHWDSFGKAFVAILVAGIPTEIVLYAMQPEIVRGPAALSLWLLLFLPLLFLVFVQTSAEELLFRSYFPRMLGSRFRSALVWAVLPGLLFTSMHFDAASPPIVNLATILMIALFTVTVTVLVWQTGNLGAAMGAHLGNNFAGIGLIAHENSLSSLALFHGLKLEDLDWTPAMAARLIAMTAFGCALTLLILLHPRSPLRVKGDRPADAGR